MLDKLIALIKQKAVFRGNFLLSSGQKSDYYIDLSKVTLDSSGLYLISSLIIDKVGRWKKVNSVGGPAMGAIPIVGGIVGLMGESSFPMTGFFVRKEAKTHGKNDLIEGILGSNAVLVEDVTTTGRSLLKAVNIVRDMGVNVSEVVSVLDRRQGATELFEREKIKFNSVITIDHIL